MNAQAAGDQNALETLLSLFRVVVLPMHPSWPLGIMPYISASIIMQLLGMAVPAVQKMQNEGESGRKQINNYTRMLTIPFVHFELQVIYHYMLIKRGDANRCIFILVDSGYISISSWGYVCCLVRRKYY